MNTKIKVTSVVLALLVVAIVLSNGIKVDFSVFNPPKPIQAKKYVYIDDTHMEWLCKSEHYKEELGELCISYENTLAKTEN